MWANFWAFYSMSLISVSVFVPYHIILITIALQYSLKSGSLIPPAFFFFLKIVCLSGAFYIDISIQILELFVPVL